MLALYIILNHVKWQNCIIPRAIPQIPSPWAILWYIS